MFVLELFMTANINSRDWFNLLDIQNTPEILEIMHMHIYERKTLAPSMCKLLPTN
jgi:hypothetical protein